MNKNTFIGISALLVAGLIWGMAFAAQKTGMKYLTPELFTCLRSFIGTAALLCLIVPLSVIKHEKILPESRRSRKDLLAGGSWCGVVLAMASTTQQYGLIYSTAGKAGFITGLYTVFIPIACFLLLIPSLCS